MKKNFLINVVFNCLLSFCCYSQSKVKNGEIKLFIDYKKSDSPLIFYWTNAFYEKPEQFVFEKSTKKIQTIETDFPIRIITVDGSKGTRPNKYTSFVVYPNDTVVISKNTKDETIFYCENSQVRTNELDFFRQLNENVGEFEGFMVGELPFSTSSNMRINIQENLYKKRVEFLENYSLKYKIRDIFKLQIQNSFYYQSLSNITFPYYSPYVTSRKKEDSLIVKKMFELIKMDEAFYYHPEYRSSILNYVVFLAKQERPTDWGKLYNTVLNNLTGNTKEILLFDILRLAFKENQSLAFPIYQSYLNDASHPVFKSYAIQNYQPQLEALKFDKLSLININDKTIIYSWDNVIRKNNFKIIYVDFWASWCRPCRAEMAASKKLNCPHSPNRIHLKVEKIINFTFKRYPNEKKQFYRGANRNDFAQS
ncbi:hypothetical protein DVG78_20525, partial [Runella aurantiaca]